MNKNLELKSINELLDKNFFIPAYQRGYRWTSRQVEDLLEDLLEFSFSKKDDDFYCLQPIVVLSEKYDNDKVRYRVVDGQQRLTTLFLIFKLFNEIEFKRPKKNYNILFETRNEGNNSSTKFLKELNIEQDINNTNIDFYYLSNNYQVLLKWFDNKLELESDFIQKIYPMLINDVKVIWYEIENENEIDVFTRLNIGKIPLTNAELIKALFLININKKYENEKILLSSQWDEIEYKLQEDQFFSFINSDSFIKPTRIEYIFDLIAAKNSVEIENLQNNDEKKNYYIFNKLIKDETTSKKYWDEVKKYFRIFNELYSDNRYYHMVGFLVHNRVKIENIVEAFISNSKKGFINYLKNEIKKVVTTNKKEIHELTYENDYKLINKILFLFNVISTMNGRFSRYPFNLHKVEKWSLEHIHAQNSENIKNDEDKKELLTSQIEYIEDTDLKEKILSLIAKVKIDDEEFTNVQNQVFEIYSDDIGIHTIDNLALLGRDDNASLNNSIFPAKRDKIKQLDKNGSFVPIGTKNVFLKYYSNDVKETLTWNRKDRESYFNELLNVLNDYMGEN